MLWVTGAKHSTWWRLPGDCGGRRCFSLMEAGCLATVQSCVERPLVHGGHTSPPASPLGLRQPSVTESLIMKTWSKRRGIPAGPAEQPKQDEGAGQSESDWKKDTRKRKDEKEMTRWKDYYSTLHSNAAIKGLPKHLEVWSTRFRMPAKMIWNEMIDRLVLTVKRGGRMQTSITLCFTANCSLCHVALYFQILKSNEIKQVTVLKWSPLSLHTL